MPSLIANFPDRYAGMGLRDLSDEMFDHYRRSGQMQHLQQAFSSLPRPETVPAEAYRRLVRNQVERVRLDEVAHRIVATSIVPYPPGIPMMMPGEDAGPADGPYIGYLRALRDWDHRFPGFGHETHGVEVDGGRALSALLDVARRAPCGCFHIVSNPASLIKSYRDPARTAEDPTPACEAPRVPART